MAKNKKHLWIIVPFITIISGIGVINLLKLDRAESSTENRTLQQRPGIQNIINKDYATLYESYYTDQFIGRENILKLYTKMEIAMNKSTVRGYYVVDDEWILPGHIAQKTEMQIEEYAQTLNRFVDSIGTENRDIYYVSTPAKSMALDFLYPAYAGQSYGMQNLDTFMSLLDDNIKPINIDRHFEESFTNDQLESFYFKTDHHWNGRGAFEGFKHVMENTDYLNQEDNILDESQYIAYNQKDKLFLGSYNRNLFSIFDKNEEVPYIYNKNYKGYEFLKHDGTEYVQTEEHLIMAPEKEFNEITYGGAYTYDVPLYNVKNDDAPIKKKLLIVRDSFQAPTTLMFADMFESVEILDPRNTMDLTPSKVIKESNPDIVMFMFHSETFETMVNMMK